MSLFENSIVHIISAIFAVVLSLSVFYSKIEDFFAIHQKIKKREDLKSASSWSGDIEKTLSEEEIGSLFSAYNDGAFISKDETNKALESSEKIVLYTTNESIFISKRDEKFFNVTRITSKGKTISFSFFQDKLKKFLP